MRGKKEVKLQYVLGKQDWESENRGKGGKEKRNPLLPEPLAGL